MTAHGVFGAQHGMTQAPLLGLDGVGECNPLGEGAKLVGGLVVAPVAQNLFDARRWREILLDGLFAPGSNDDYLLYTRRRCLLNNVLNGRPVN